ncbi:hypothetical protein GCM10020367_20550 [Streptomyces sannanensis]|uniref:Uncharacterized protein n=1 Tax=Streptomyces sannanensis TaxID=285536 RepID=A0ABP6S992_9ACTN
MDKTWWVVFTEGSGGRIDILNVHEEPADEDERAALHGELWSDCLPYWAIDAPTAEDAKEQILRSYAADDAALDVVADHFADFTAQRARAHGKH